MKASTVAALERINRDFYRRRALEFSGTRKQPWPGWSRVVELAQRNLASARIAILDLGCGNGRFLREVCRILKGTNVEVSHLGIDASLPLLALASEAGNQANPEQRVASRLIAADLVSRPLSELEITPRFDLVVCFGLMHHIPSGEARRRLLSESALRLRAGGVMAVSFWQFGDQERFKDRMVPWSSRVDGEFDARDLETGDYLLAWGDAGAVRYCHFADAPEAQALVGDLDLEPLASFREDGGSRDLNLYHVLRKPVSGPDERQA